MKKVIGLFLCAIVFVGALSMVGCTETANVSAKASYITIDINPSVELVVDGDNKVVSVSALNVDGEIMLQNLELVGLNIDQATDLYIAKAAELGYIDVDATEQNPNEILITAVSDEDTQAEEIKEKIYTRVDNFLFNHGIWGVVFTQEQKQEIKNEAKELNISVGKLRMIKSIIISYPEKTVDELKELSVKELVELVKAKNPALALMENYRLRKEMLEAIENRTEEEQTELDEISEILENNEQLRENLMEKSQQRLAKSKEKFDKMQQQREERKEKVQNRWQKFKENRENRSNQG